jgi:hypothetical protein
MTTAVTNRRRHARLPAAIRIFTKDAAHPFSDAVKDISLGGAQVLTATPLAAGTISTFALQLPHHDAPLEVNGRVVWSKPGAMGVQFVTPEPRLVAYVDRLERDATRF